MYTRDDFFNIYSYRIYEVLQSYALAWKLSRDIVIDIYTNDKHRFDLTRTDKGGSDAMIASIIYHPQMKKKNIEIYSMNHDALKRINEAGDLVEFIEINKERAKLNRLGIQDVVILLDSPQKLQEFLGAADKYF